MILITLKAYFLKVKRTTLHHLIKEFDIDENTLIGMLSVWEKKGKLRKVVLNHQHCHTSCGGCQLGCLSQRESLMPQYIYEWVENSGQLS